ncbi:hypothetical protein VNI00_004478 [Paramarasmius palmivorus]|uniref:Uncharacterized protein n=1 Tax=Paramarasmius palmivorus TaxID=297713 RepID=A0AAW0DKF4_9AGAR
MDDLEYLKEHRLLERLPESHELRVALGQLHTEALRLKTDMYVFKDGPGRQMSFCNNFKASFYCTSNRSRSENDQNNLSVSITRGEAQQSGLQTVYTSDWGRHKKYCGIFPDISQGCSPPPSYFDGYFIQSQTSKRLQAQPVLEMIMGQLRLRNIGRKSLKEPLVTPSRETKVLVIVCDYQKWPVEFSAYTYEDELRNICVGHEGICYLKDRMKTLRRTVEVKSDFLVSVRLPPYSPCERRWVWSVRLYLETMSMKSM